MIEIETICGDEITQTIAKAFFEAKKHNDQCKFNFNDVTIIVAPDTSLDLIYRDWERAISGYLGNKPTIGPHPIAELTEEELARDKAIEASNEASRKARQQQYEQQSLNDAQKLEAALKDAGPIELSDESAWKNYVEKNRDPYGGRCVKYAEDWGRLMQVQIAQGKTVVECAQETSRLADFDGITGFMYGAAVSMLSKCWKHGEALRRWHNKETQIGTEGDEANEKGGVLNPAMLSIG